jgi:D-alanyl-D-alanine carboxypeptidase/D-alanyl-D-alanine-endopeptidase (penicillin-binding protein 4)
VPLVLALGVIGGAGGALAVEAGASATQPTVGGAGARTPVLSVRRLPSVVAAPISDRRLRTDLDVWAVDTSASSCVVVEDESGRTVLDLRGDLPLAPASTLKLATATAALLQLGADARFHTAAFGSGPTDGTVDGDLTLVGGGDPILATSDYAARFKNQPQTFTDLGTLAQRISDAGVRRITGSVVGDDGRYDRERYVAGWPQRYIAQDVVGPLSALAVNDGFASFPPAWNVYRELVGAPDPAAQGAALLTLQLEARGVDVAGAPRSGTVSASTSELAAIDSPPLSEVLAEMLQESDNSTAELLLKEIGRGALDPTTTGGRVEATRLLAATGADLSGVVLADGSGLSLDNRVTCHLLVQLLDRPGTGPVLRAGLAVAGETGTLAERFVDTPLAGHLRAKTGSLNTVAGMAGVVTDDDGTFTFAYLVNGSPAVDQNAVMASQERLAEILLRYPRVPEVARLGPLPVGGAQQR